MAQETRLVQDRATLQRFLDEISLLSRGDLPVDEYLRRLLQMTLSGLGGQGGAIWFQQGAEFQRACSSQFAETEYDSDEPQRRSIHNALQDVAQHRRPLVVGPFDAESALQEGTATAIINHTPFPFFYVPIIMVKVTGEPLVLSVLQVWMPSGVDPKNYKDVVSFLQAVAGQAGVFLRARRVEALAASTDKLQQLVRFVSELNGQLDLPMLGLTIVNWAREIIGCDRCALFIKKTGGKLRALAISNVEVVDEKSALIQCQRMLVQDCLSAGQATLYRKASPKTEALGDISDYFFHSHANEALALPLTDHEGKQVGGLLLESHKEKQIDDGMRKLAFAIVAPSGRALAMAQEIAELPLIGQLKRYRKLRQALQSDQRKYLWTKVGVPAGAIVLLALMPWRFALQADCVVMPKVRAVAVAEVNGRVVEVFAEEGDRVGEGQPLARLDDSELRQNLAMMEQEKIKYETEADRSEVLRDEGGRRVALINAARAGKQIEQLNRKIQRTYIRSPINGVVLSKDLRYTIGMVLEVGSHFCEIGDLNGWEVTTRVNESEVALLDARLRRSGRLPVRFMLHSMPGQQFHATMMNPNAISQMSYQVPHANVFLARALVEVSPELESKMKAGYTGRSKISLEWRPAGYVVTRKFFNYVRIRWLF